MNDRQLINKHTIDYLLYLADNNLVLSQNNSEWCGHGPVLEQDIAITNISLDLLGQARSLYQYAAQLITDSGEPLQTFFQNPAAMPANTTLLTEDSLAYLRTERDFKNALLTELPEGDWAFTILRQCFFSTYQYLLYQQLLLSKDQTLAAIAEKSLKEVTYHLRWSSEWVIRLGDGTNESRQRILNACMALWNYTGELFLPADFETQCADQHITVNPATLKQSWLDKTQHIFTEATLDMPDPNAYMHTGGKIGLHTEHMGYLLAEMQSLQRAHPGAEW